MTKLVIVGCGPKAISIASKAHVLKKLGWQVPEIVIVDKFGPAANWDSSNGYTDGDTILGTTPLEDVGFPYESLIDSSVDVNMLEYSYMAYLIDSQKYTEWVDRGLTPPTHSMFADYFKWVFKNIDAPLTVGEVTAISREKDSWKVTYETDSGEDYLLGDGLVLTGPGEPYQFPRTGNGECESRIFNGKNIWKNIDQFVGLKNAKIAVIGAGETSAGAVTGLLNVIDKTSQIEIISRHPILFTRNENWMEVMYFSKVMNWAELTIDEKKEVIRHSDRGTFSVAAKNMLDAVYNVSTKLGDVSEIDITGDKLKIIFTENIHKQTTEYDYVIEATGFDPISLSNLFTDQNLMQDYHNFEAKIMEDLSVSDILPKLHIPGLSAIAQGPGFPNLSCLGMLSERILIPYISK